MRASREAIAVLVARVEKFQHGTRPSRWALSVSRSFTIEMTEPIGVSAISGKLASIFLVLSPCALKCLLFCADPRPLNRRVVELRTALDRNHLSMWLATNLILKSSGSFSIAFSIFLPSGIMRDLHRETQMIKSRRASVRTDKFTVDVDAQSERPRSSSKEHLQKVSAAFGQAFYS
jgi:hypothetical protein